MSLISRSLEFQTERCDSGTFLLGSIGFISKNSTSAMLEAWQSVCA
jgi:hypothetical protein